MQVPDPRALDVLAYWFGRKEPPFEARMGLWFGGGDAIDEEIRGRFGDTIEHALEGRLDDWAADPYGRVALIIVLDQFARNAYRGTAKAFAGDRRAQRLVVEAFEQGEDRSLDVYARFFLNVVLEHAEDHDLQDLAVDKARALVRDAPDPEKDRWRAFQGYVEDHAGIVHRFGRFPDRNRILGRKTTDAEAAFLAAETRGWFEDQEDPDGRDGHDRPRDRGIVDVDEFDRLAKVYDRLPGITHPKAVRKAIGRAGGVVLDLAGGTGKYAVRMHHDRDRVLVLDANHAMLRRNRVMGRATEPIRGLGDRLPLPDRSVDVVTCTEAFHHFGHDQEAIVDEVARVLRPDGVLVIEELDPTRWWGRLVVWGHKKEGMTGDPDTGAEPLRFHTPERLMAMLRDRFGEVSARRASWGTFTVRAARPGHRA